MTNKLIQPTIEFCKEIENYRNEMIQNNDSFDGCSDLRKFENMEEWVKYTYDLQDKNKIPARFLTMVDFLRSLNPIRKRLRLIINVVTDIGICAT